MTSNDEMPLKNDTAKIIVSKKGPYIISGEIPIRRQVIILDSDGTATEWQSSTKYPRQKTCALCRCGKSKKPYCEGTPAKTGFEGTETAGDEAYLNQPEEIYGPMLKLEDVETYAPLHASATAQAEYGTLFRNRTTQKTSRQPSKKPMTVLLDASSFRIKKTGITIEPNLPQLIGFIEGPAMRVSGPIWVRGGIPVESADGKTYKIRDRVTLCRCGKSANKPFCDNSHYPEAEDVEKVHNE